MREAHEKDGHVWDRKPPTLGWRALAYVNWLVLLLPTLLLALLTRPDRATQLRLDDRPAKSEDSAQYLSALWRCRSRWISCE
jgi:hypothetical protein